MNTETFKINEYEVTVTVASKLNPITDIVQAEDEQVARGIAMERYGAEHFNVGVRAYH